MKKIILCIAILFSSFLAICQPLNNEWIDYSKTYYKFKVGSTGLYRINQPVLAANGLGNVLAPQFQLWRNGVEVPLFTSVSTGVLSANDFIEFYGQINDGKVDKDLYKNPANQLSDKLSLFSDTATYFLTVNKATPNLRYVFATNNVAGNTLPSESYFMHSLRFNFRERANRGYAVYYGEDIYSSSYDAAEFLSTKDINITDGAYKIPLGNLYLASSSQQASVIAGLAGNANKNRSIKLNINSNTILTKTFNGFAANINTINNIALSSFNGNTDTASIQIVTSDTYDRAVASFFELQYPRQFNFNNQTSFEFSLPSSGVGNYLRISNFNNNGAIPVLYDATNLKYYNADTSITGILQFVIPATSATTNYVLISRSNTSVTSITNIETKSFINFSTSSNQADYLIVSNKILTSGSNAVEQYRQYRSTASGGSFNAKVFDIDELTDQFAYGVKKHPLSIRNFLRFAKASFAATPKYVFLIGKAVTYDEYRMFKPTSEVDDIEKQDLVPTFGWPASDALLVSPNSAQPAPILPFGRLSAITQQEVTDYLDKVKLYEQQGASTTQSIANKLWMKQLVHVAGADDIGLSNLLTYYLKGYETIATDTNYCGTTVTLSKTSGSATNVTQNDIAKLFESGIGLLTYFGHSAASGLAYNLNNPDDYNNYGKYPVFLVNGCSAGNFFDYDVQRFVKPTCLAEKFVFAKNKGSIAFIATSHFGVTTPLDYYSTGFYNSVSKLDYGKSIGVNMLSALNHLKVTSNNLADYLSNTHAEQFLLHGDPAIKVYASEKPDFVVEDPQVKISPTFVSILDNSFTVKASIYNIGKGTGDSVKLVIKRTFPNNSVVELINKKIPSIKYLDDTSVNITIPINALADKGNNSITITIDADNQYDELSENNNSVTKQFVIFEDEIKPIYPYNYSIINTSQSKLSASTANVFTPLRQYVMEMDTTTLFNSTFKISKTISSVGGLIEFDPAITFTDSTVYYWRVATIPSTGSDYRWANSSFVYLKNATTSGFNQSHFYQHCESNLNNIVADTSLRKFNFTSVNNSLTIYNSILPFNDRMSIAVNDAANPVTYGSCYRDNNITFTVYNQSSLAAMYNCSVGQQGQYGSLFYTNGCIPGKEYDFSFETKTSAGRKAAMDFMDNAIQNGSYVVVRPILAMYRDGNNNVALGQPTFAQDWKQDESLFGTGNSLYHRLKTAGFNDIDSFNRLRSFAFVYQKNNTAFTPVSKLSIDSSDIMMLKVNVATKPTQGTIVSPKFGPATKWYNMLWTGNRNDLQDIIALKLLGVKADNTVDTLYNYTETQINNDISTIDATTYPYLKIYMQVKDTVNLTAYQLKYWRLLADVLPEGALMPINFVFKDTLQKGEMQNISMAFKNVSNTAYGDSLEVKLNIIDNANVTNIITVPKLKKLLPGNVDTIKTTINSASFVGNNNFYISINPNDAPKEQTLTNNFAFKKFFVNGDNINPVLDVTFDGIHILNNDIVSSKPNIRLALKDEAKYMLLNDTATISVQLKFPDGTVRKYKYDNDTLRFIPAASDGKNTATAEFNPNLLMDGTYELFVQAKDKSENAAGPQQYRVQFVVNNKPMISNVFNYPNPFTTSTAFVFTLTGTQVPDNIRIQILTVTGKIVKEITKTELGNLHIGRNITDYKWDGTDMYGAALGNGVYLYRVITSLDNKALDKFTPTDNFGTEINTDQYFKAGYGKMYLMR